MIFIDSWVWIEFFSEGDKGEEVREILEPLDERTAVISPTVLMEVKYRIKEGFSEPKAERAISLIQSLDGVEILPVTTEVALFAADLREKYYDRKDREMSYADAIHLATAVIAGCDTFYSGDPDFSDIDEIDTEIV